MGALRCSLPQTSSSDRQLEMVKINATLYSTCFTGMARSTSRCELCLATTHTDKECALQGTSDPNLSDRLKTLESLVLPFSPKPDRGVKPAPREPSGEPYRLWNLNRCTYARCRHKHVCNGCEGNHRVLQYHVAGQWAGPSRGPRYPPAKPY